MQQADKEDIELELLIRALLLRYGYDFSQYARASLKRRVLSLADHCRARNVSEITQRVVHEEGFIREVIAHLSVPVSEMFRDPWVFVALREQVLPILASFPQINVWQAGCAGGEEVYSLAILLKEEGLYDRARIFATDFNDVVLEKAAEAVYPAREARAWSENYRKAGGRSALSDYFHARYDFIKLEEALKQHVTFANHNLVSDGVFGEMQLILCRNVLIYFNSELQERVLQLFRESLVRGGFLCLGTKETLRFSRVADHYQALNVAASLYRYQPRPA